MKKHDDLIERVRRRAKFLRLHSSHVTGYNQTTSPLLEEIADELEKLIKEKGEEK